jgi:hypothetical protein
VGATPVSHPPAERAGQPEGSRPPRLQRPRSASAAPPAVAAAAADQPRPAASALSPARPPGASQGKKPPTQQQQLGHLGEHARDVLHGERQAHAQHDQRQAAGDSLRVQPGEEPGVLQAQQRGADHPEGEQAGHKGGERRGCCLQAARRWAGRPARRHCAVVRCSPAARLREAGAPGRQRIRPRPRGGLGWGGVGWGGAGWGGEEAAHLTLPRVADGRRRGRWRGDAVATQRPL